MDGFLSQSFIFLCAGVIAVLIAKRLGLGSVLGYLLAGIAIAPLIGRFGIDAHRLQEFAEFGVVMMLFLVGLELEPRQLWEMRHRLLGLGGLQVAGTAVAVWLIALGMDIEWQVGLAIGLVATGSSTAIVLQTLTEKGFLKSDGGKASFAVLLFQDISVIPILALLPLLASPKLAANVQPAAGAQGVNLLQGLPGWLTGSMTMLAVAAVVFGGHFLARPLFRFVAASQLREAFSATALMLVIGIALLMTFVGLSPALGTFVAGVVLANSEYRHELESDIEPFKALLLGLFFITVGAGIDFGVLSQSWLLIAGLTCVLLVVKATVLWLIGRAFRLRDSDRWLFALGLAQTGEFAFVLIAFTVQNAIIPETVAKLLLLVVALSMLLTPLLFILFERVILPRTIKMQARKDDEIDVEGVAIVAGIGRFGQVVNRMLRSIGYETVVLDLSAETVDTMAHLDVKAFFGDASRPALLEAAGLAHARLLVVAIDDREQAVEIVKYAKRLRPDLHVISRAYDQLHLYDLHCAGSNEIIRETFDGAVRAGQCSLEVLGIHPYEAERIAKTYVRGNLRSVRKLAELYDPDVPPTQNPEYIALLKQVRKEEDEMMSVSRAPAKGRARRAWLPPSRNRECACASRPGSVSRRGEAMTLNPAGC